MRKANLGIFQRISEVRDHSKDSCCPPSAFPPNLGLTNPNTPDDPLASPAREIFFDGLIVSESTRRMSEFFSVEKAADPGVWHMMGWGLAGGFLATLVAFCLLLFFSNIDHGFLGLILLLVLIIFLVAFSFLVAAATPSISTKIAIVVIDGALALGSKLVSDRFLVYLESGDEEAATNDS